MAIGVFRRTFLQVARVRQENSAKIARGRGAEYPALETMFHQQWQIAGMIEMRVSEDDSIDRTHVDRQRRPVAQAQLLETLEQTAIYQNPVMIRLQQIFRAGDGANRAKERNPHHRATSRMASAIRPEMSMPLVGCLTVLVVTMRAGRAASRLSYAAGAKTA